MQINLHHSKAATASLCQKLAKGLFDIALIQEPWLHKGKVSGLGGAGGSIYSLNTSSKPRTCIYVKNKRSSLPLTHFCSNDLTAVKIKFQRGDITEDLIIASVYLPYDTVEPPPTKELRDIISYSSDNHIQLLAGCDANAHHITWGSSNCNSRGESLLEYLCSTNMGIRNSGNKPTFVISNREEVIDLTLGSNKLWNLITNWHVSDDLSFSDHRYICFNINSTVGPVNTYRSPKKTDWEGYIRDLKEQLLNVEIKTHTVTDIEDTVDKIQDSILFSYQNNCPTKPIHSTKCVPWWTKKLSELRSNARKKFNAARVAGNWEIYREALTCYNRELRKAKRASWRDFCKNIENTPDKSKIGVIMAKDKAEGLSTIKLPDGKFTDTGEGTLKQLFKVHFPGSKVLNQTGIEQESSNTIGTKYRTNRDDWLLAKSVINQSKIKWAIGTFKPFKSPGSDGIIPAFLQQGINLLTSPLCYIFRACLAFGYIPKAWRQVNIVFIPKPGRENYTEEKAFRPISLTSFLLKTLEKLVDRHLRDGALRRNPLHQYQFAYSPGKSTETALHEVVLSIEKAINYKELALGTFLDIEGAFDQTTYDVITNAAKRHKVEHTICRWINSMLKSRTVASTLFGDTVRASADRGCPQGGVLSPLLWSLVVDELLVILEGKGIKAIGYADDIAIIVSGKFPRTVSEVTQSAIMAVEEWCNKVGLKINPKKTVLVPFTKKRKLEGLIEPTLFGIQISLSDQVKYLGVIIDKRLSWKQHVDYICDKACRVFWACRRTFGKTWGLKPKTLYWVYTTVIKPVIIYAALVWWPRTKLVSCESQLSKVQRLACMGITGAIRTAPTAAIEVLLGLPPLQIVIEAEARLGLYRLVCNGLWNHKRISYGHTNFKWDRELDSLLQMNSDKMTPKYHYHKPFTVRYPTYSEWDEEKGFKPKKPGLIWYTDGSKTDHGTGAGGHCWGTKTKFSYSLGQYPTVFQAEIYAIIECALENINKAYKNRNIYILSDSQAALKALESSQFTSKLVWDCLTYLTRLGEHNKVHLVWVPQRNRRQ